MELISVIVDGTETVRHVAVVGAVGPAVNAARSHAGLGNGLAQHEIHDVGLVYQQVGGNTARVVPIQAPLEIALRVPGVLRRGARGDG